MRLRLLACLAPLLLAGCTGSEEPDGPDTPAVEVTEVDGGPVGVTAVEGDRAWTALAEQGAVRTDDGTTIPVGEAPLRLVSTPSGVWVSVIGDGTIVRIDPATGEVDRTVKIRPAGSEPEGIAWDGKRLWVVDQAHGRVLALDDDGGVQATYRTDDGPRLVAVGDSGVWVTNYGGSSLTRVADDHARTVWLKGCTGPQGVAEIGGRVWVACTLSGKVVAFDAATLEPAGEVTDLPDADAVVARDHTVYVVGQSGPTVYEIDATTGELTDTVPLDTARATTENVDAALVGPDLVVTHPDTQRIYRAPAS
ncbi:Vgb family protein [Nocardioides mangrovi]|uniref:YncE family protein n=1 Tax=Nocardioides mangrovi TaxID=2874580 RepID=A0ABS7U809_9ACTN|nr:hypothetical protein [Nocardioides mangrovi]MBZ5736843.1 hypothetical protein [Nocardioides mangrovi]